MNGINGNLILLNKRETCPKKMTYHYDVSLLKIDKLRVPHRGKTTKLLGINLFWWNFSTFNMYIQYVSYIKYNTRYKLGLLFMLNFDPVFRISFKQIRYLTHTHNINYSINIWFITHWLWGLKKRFDALLLSM